MTCPVCERSGLTADLSSCPRCDADLRGLRLVAALQAVPPAPPRHWGWLAGVAVALLGGGWLLGHGLNRPAPDITASVATETVPRMALVAARDSLRLRLVAPPVVPPVAPTFTYVVRRGDTLRGIAWRLYGRAGLAGRLQTDNSVTEPKRLQIGQRLRVFAL
jgi:nucleoid-associated protein YgaU